jgi:flagellar basal-body rod protein FlgF
MMAASLVLLSDQMALQRTVDIVANNVANSSTTGFKREGIQFNTLLSQLQSGAANNEGVHFVIDKSTFRDAAPGTMSTTGNPLDVGIQGPGYFQVQTKTGQTQYTRDGAFRTDDQGQLVTSTGQPVLSDGGQPITIPDEASDITVGGDGFITAQVGTGNTRAQLGKIGVVQFADEQQVIPAGNNLFTTAQAAIPSTDSRLMQGVIEESNVQPITEMTNLIQIQRAYEQATNMISQENTRLGNAIDKLSQTT